MTVMCSLQNLKNECYEEKKTFSITSEWHDVAKIPSEFITQKFPMLRSNFVLYLKGDLSVLSTQAL
jgi:hypothetical protein